MKAAVLESEGVLTYTDVPDPAPMGDRSVLVRVGGVGVCGSDVLRFGRGTAYHYPLVLGHEFSAVVEDAPADSRFAKGDRAAVFPLLPDPADPMAQIGEYGVSSGYDYYGSRRDGALAELLHVPEANLVPVPAGTPLVHAAVVEPAAVALHAMLKFQLPPHATALVIGAGPIGALAAQWLRILGASEVYVADVDARKRQVMAGLGFPVIDASGGTDTGTGATDTVAAVRELTGGRGVDCAVEATGLPATLLQAVTAAAPLGQVMLLGDLSGDLTLPRSVVSSVLRRELRIYGTWNSKITPAGRSEWDMVVHHLGRDLQVAPLISHTPALEEAPRIFPDLLEKRIWYSKVVFAVSEEARAELAQPATAGGAV